jgi:hypothetical protein
VKDGGLKVAFSEVLRGFSATVSPSFGEIRIKHFNNFDSAELDVKNKDFYDKAVSEGLTTREERVDYLLRENIWTEEKNKEILNTKTAIVGIEKTKSKVFLQSHVDQANEELRKQKLKLFKLEIEKEELIGFTAEAYASRRINEHYMFNAILGENDEKLFGRQEFEELEEDKMTELIGMYNKNTNKFNSNTLKLVSVSGFYSNLFHLCNNDAYVFYGKPLVELTFYQIELFGYGRYHKSLIENSEHKPPEEITQNPQKLVEWFDSGKNIKEVLDKSQNVGKQGSATSLVGASKQDLKRLGLDNPNETINLAKKAAEKGGRLSMDDLMKLHGV